MLLQFLIDGRAVIPTGLSQESELGLVLRG